jgi:glycosyltransferase involved in cell wall biosynthesis
MPVPIVHIQKMKGACGSENHLLSLLGGLDKTRFEPHYWILVEPGDRFPEYVSRLAKDGVRSLEIPIRADFDPGLIVRLVRHLRRLRPGLVHTHLIHADLHGTVAAVLAGVPVRVSSRHNDDRFRTRPWIRLLNRGIANRQHRIVGISHWVSDFVRRVEGIGREKVVTIHYGLDDLATPGADRSFLKEKYGIPDGRRLLITLGRLTEQKGQIHLIRALPKIVDRFPDVLLVMMGEGDLRETYRSEIGRLGLTEAVRMLGYVSPPGPVLRCGEMFVHPSLWEGFGLVLLEAMAYRIPIVASRVSAIPEIVEDGKTGLLVPPGDSEALADAVIRLLDRPEEGRTMGKKGRDRLEAEFSVKKMVMETERLYDRLLSAPAT